MPEVKCTNCGGSGIEPFSKGGRCLTCGGSGTIKK